jgi:2'-5' RNA ligase
MVNTMEQIRAFIAIELPEKQRKFLSHLQSMVSKNTGISAKWVDPYGIHLTLKFLGNITTVQVEEI